jgi:hypothetical protein
MREYKTFFGVTERPGDSPHLEHFPWGNMSLVIRLLVVMRKSWFLFYL